MMKDKKESNKESILDALNREFEKEQRERDDEFVDELMREFKRHHRILNKNKTKKRA
ncbi:TPA: hypothetical protein JG812_000115 [Vibrio parahaemolyticus]|uniref:hypothetical protein n=1 Tax=Vibrio harveyi group TaxID=717610 RepID=UPI0018C8F4C2|nr:MULTISPECIES: hypothetical protein [Vibrio harveyi group]EJY5652755.1 hypothetical protein [Vibrio cholerae]EKQ5898991.1 hypothetical protein [Vibrio parahaemolyticus]ELB2243280.1 hypothetical protein [Vibrio parahaemolyticus]ELU0551181.1 hypothetical protein [Vibrio parahaemolyticus]MDF5009762.1 hypothetical protein [Vibrio parahaemolyticus]